MPTNRKITFANGQYYHLFNRGVERRPVFTSKYEFLRATELLNYYIYRNVSLRYSKYLALNIENKRLFLSGLNKKNKLIEVVAYCFMNNHFHFLVKQNVDNGISIFMAKFTNSYTKYFNTKKDRVGPLFQGLFKAIHVEDNEQLIHLSRYIHLNPVTGFIIKSEELRNYIWSSYPLYLKDEESNLISKSEILGFFKNTTDYESFVLDQVSNAQAIKTMEHLMID